MNRHRIASKINPASVKSKQKVFELALLFLAWNKSGTAKLNTLAVSPQDQSKEGANISKKKPDMPSKWLLLWDRMI
jgi:hypothetical protein